MPFGQSALMKFADRIKTDHLLALLPVLLAWLWALTYLLVLRAKLPWCQNLRDLLDVSQGLGRICFVIQFGRIKFYSQLVFWRTLYGICEVVLNPGAK